MRSLNVLPCVLLCLVAFACAPIRCRFTREVSAERRDHESNATNEGIDFVRHRVKEKMTFILQLSRHKAITKSSSHHGKRDTKLLHHTSNRMMHIVTSQTYTQPRSLAAFLASVQEVFHHA